MAGEDAVRAYFEAHPMDGRIYTFFDNIKSGDVTEANACDYISRIKDSGLIPPGANICDLLQVLHKERSIDTAVWGKLFFEAVVQANNYDPTISLDSVCKSYDLSDEEIDIIIS